MSSLVLESAPMKVLLIALILLIAIPPAQADSRPQFDDAVLVATSLGRGHDIDDGIQWNYVHRNLRIKHIDIGTHGKTVVRCDGVIVGRWVYSKPAKGVWLVDERVLQDSACWALLAQIAQVVRV